MSVSNIEQQPVPDQPCYPNNPNNNSNLDLTGNSFYANSRSPASVSSASLSPYLLPGSPEDSDMLSAPIFGDFSQQLSPKQQETPRKSTRKSVCTFINKLYSMVGDNRHQHLISWNASGMSFFISNAKEFAKQVLPEYFKHGNFSSFVRQLNMYGFRKINKSSRGQNAQNNDFWEFSHPKFIRDQPKLLKEINRKALDSEMLQRETGEMHASFSMMQTSQNELLNQLQVLQQNFAQLLQGFEDLKRIQSQQQMIIQNLSNQSVGNKDNRLSPPHDFTEKPRVFVSSPNVSANVNAHTAPSVGIRPATIMKNMPPVTGEPSPVSNNTMHQPTPELYMSDYSNALGGKLPEQGIPFDVSGTSAGFPMDTNVDPPITSSPMESVFWGSPASQSCLSSEDFTNFSTDDNLDDSFRLAR